MEAEKSIDCPMRNKITTASFYRQNGYQKVKAAS
jgi:hypothetical protein